MQLQQHSTKQDSNNDSKMFDCGFELLQKLNLQMDE